MRASFPPASFDRIGPAVAGSPLVCAVPHAGRHYPADLLNAAAVPHDVLEELEDRHADQLVRHVVAAGAVAVVSHTARAWIDLNRGEDDLDPAWRDPPGSGPPASARARGGLGLIPERVGRRPLWRIRPTVAEVATRIATHHRPYHAAVATALREAVRLHGFAVLLDCHSMPPLRGARPARVVIGDRHGRSAGAGIARALRSLAEEAGYPAALNDPYAGAYGIAFHGRPDDGVHALQIELDRSLYLRSDMRTVDAGGTEQAGRLIAALADKAVALARPSFAVAAE